MTPVNDSHHRFCWLYSELPEKRERRVNRWDAVTDGEWGSEAGQQRCATFGVTDIIYRTEAILGADKVSG